MKKLSSLFMLSLVLLVLITPNKSYAADSWRSNDSEYQFVTWYYNDLTNIPIGVGLSYSYHVLATTGYQSLTTNEQVYYTIIDDPNAAISQTFDLKTTVAILDGSTIKTFYDIDFNDGPSLEYIFDGNDDVNFVACKDRSTFEYPDSMKATYYWDTPDECIPSFKSRTLSISF
ncbi:hypothetical protein [Tepidibacter aestuarii]|uniref:hypothetical protein n=1 Tax=Tepidibacter aestuarii TaxID=2925782 RepID=UPI0020BF80F0|nr:hypothetical protein [Tepidibacter aestuarii]CAH2213183.1 exported protein of unknown function [Tepidibacter aestuarii]